MDIKSKINQYGPSNSIKRLIKYIFRKLGINFESFWYMGGDIDIDFLRDNMAKYSFSDVRELTFSDFEHADQKAFNDEKLKVIRDRFENGKFWSYGVFDNSKLVYSCWITTSVISYPNKVTKKTALSENEGFLEDSYCHPDYRGRGYHTKMNLFRLHNLYEKNKTRAIGIVLYENLPALRSLEKIGFKREKKITFLNLFGRQYYIEKL